MQISIIHYNPHPHPCANVNEEHGFAMNAYPFMPDWLVYRDTILCVYGTQMHGTTIHILRSREVSRAYG